jgi:cytoskeletal protein CcmA (bactofilin family)
MFSKKTEEGNFNEVETIIGQSVKVKGNFQGEGNIVVEGIIEGGLKTTGNVLVGEQAKISANIEANEARIGGEVLGNIKVKNLLEIEATAKINGDVECSLLSIERGAIVNGKFLMNSSIKHKEQIAEENE